MTNYILKIDNKEVQWGGSKLAGKLEKIGKLSGKDVAWIRSDLKVTPSDWFSRFIWTLIAKFFSWMRENFYQVNLDKSRVLLAQLEPQIQGNEKLRDLFHQAVSNFNRIAPRHAYKTKDMELIEKINSNPEQGAAYFKSQEDFAAFTKKYSPEITSLSAKFNLSASMPTDYPNLKHLLLHQVKLTDEVMTTLSNFPNLQSLKFKACTIEWSEGKGLAQLKKQHLKEFKLDDCPQVSHHILQEINTLTALQKLNLSYSANVSLSQLMGLANLHELIIKGIDVIDPELTGLSAFTNLKALDLSTNPVDGTGLKFLTDPSQLESLYMLGCMSLNEKGIEQFIKFTNLKILNLSYYWKITDANLQTICELKNLRELHLSHCPLITLAGLQHLIKLTHLNTLNLVGCNVNDEALTHLYPFKKLEKLYISEKYVTQTGLDKLQAKIPGLKILVE